MKAAIYLRKSTDDNDKAADDKSVEQQRRSTLAFIVQKQWTLDEEHIYIDDGISGGEWQKRPALLKLMDAARAGEFNVLVMRDFDRLGRDAVRNPIFIEQLTQCGVGIWLADSGEQIKFETPTDKMMVGMKAGFGEHHRYESSKQGHMRAKDMWNQKRNFGGRTYGYDNIWVHPDGKRQLAPVGQNKPFKDIKTYFQINETEADVIRRIYRAYANGHGVKAIAKALNGDPDHADLSKRYFDDKRPPSPWKGTRFWAPSSVRAILHNVRYTGRIPFGARKWVYVKGTKGRKLTGTVQYADAPELEIVNNKLWDSVRTRHEQAKKTYIRDTNGRLWGRPGMSRESKYLLTSLAHCSCCAGNIVAQPRPSGSPPNRRTIFYYACSYHNNRGRTACVNDTREQMLKMDDAVLNAIEQQVLNPDAIAYVVEKALYLLADRRRTNTDRPREIEAELKKLQRELARFNRAIADGRAPKSVLAEITAREARIEALEKERDELSTEEPSELDLRRLRKSAEAQTGRFKDLIHGDVPLARQSLRKLLAEPLRFIPIVRDGRKTYAFKGQTRVGALVDPAYLEGALPRGFEPLLPA